jgi:hypothetical protein
MFSCDFENADRNITMIIPLFDCAVFCALKSSLLVISGMT